MTLRTSTEIAAELEAVRAQRKAVATGGGVVEIMRDGRRMRMEVPGLSEFKALIADLEREYDQAVQGESGRRRRSFIPVSFK